MSPMHGAHAKSLDDSKPRTADGGAKPEDVQALVSAPWSQAERALCSEPGV